MPKVLSHTPAWLTRPHPAFDALAGAQVLANRGTEVFAAVGREIRWADLATWKELPPNSPAPVYRTLRVSVPLPITRLVISPHGDYMAVSTSHTVHVVILPDSSLLESEEPGAIKPKSFQIGPTAHVREESPIASILWHPLGYYGRCLVTVTREGVVRLWELNRSDRSSFSEPALSIDLQKLANATSDEDNLGASMYGASKGFSPDSVELEVASACFGDFPDQEGVHGWAPMTLWIAMIEGDIYALCPLLPSRWQLQESAGASTFLETLASSISTNLAENDEASAEPEEVETAKKQYSWLSDILYEEALKENMPWGDPVQVYRRPHNVSAYPMLQGPFSLQPEVDEFELCDLSDAAEEGIAEGLPAAVVCLLTDTGEVHVCLDAEGIKARWLPSPSVS
jgi:nucleoporin NUP82